MAVQAPPPRRDRSSSPEHTFFDVAGDLVLALAPFSLALLLTVWTGAQQGNWIVGLAVGTVMALGFISILTSIRAVRTATEYRAQRRAASPARTPAPRPQPAPAPLRPSAQVLSLPWPRPGRVNPALTASAEEEASLGEVVGMEEKVG